MLLYVEKLFGKRKLLFQLFIVPVYISVGHELIIGFLVRIALKQNAEICTEILDLMAVSFRSPQFALGDTFFSKQCLYFVLAKLSELVKGVFLIAYNYI